ncbi:transposase [Streptomyces sp. NPDC046939]|uniref:transposase n=1 Tax=Streptomyces sp. NPDC046939 TaxID=3155376 RepID=UPI0033E17D82
MPTNRVLPVDRVLRDGSWFSRLHATTDRARQDPVTVRILAYRFEHAGRAAADHRLVTSLLAAGRFPARQLATLYQERWKVESVLAELKTCRRGAHAVLSSKTPDGAAADLGPPAGPPVPCAS